MCLLLQEAELLAFKLALEQWRHWLEGAHYCFKVITDYWNLEYLHEDKQPNPPQARWTLFFTRFDFIVTYRPGHKSCKAGALSLLYHPEPESNTPEPVLPPAMIVSPIQWPIDDQILQATITETAPPGGPEGWLYVPSTSCLSVMDSAHTSPSSGAGSQANPLVPGGPPWPWISSGTLKGAHSVPSPTHQGNL